MKVLDEILQKRLFEGERSYNSRINLCFQPDAFADFGQHPEFGALFEKFTRHDRFRGMDISRLWCLILNLKRVLSRVDGSLAELGVYKGHSSAVIGHFARSVDRRMYLMDTFTGFARQQIESELSDNAKAAFKDTSLEHAKETVGDHPNFRWLVGPFPDSVTPELQADRFSFVSIDCDLYEPILGGLRFFFPRMNKGGLIFVHDYSSGHWPGATKAVDEFVAESGAGCVLLADKSGSAVITC